MYIKKENQTMQDILIRVLLSFSGSVVIFFKNGSPFLRSFYFVHRPAVITGQCTDREYERTPLSLDGGCCVHLT